jgi:hypothetical protein
MLVSFFIPLIVAARVLRSLIFILAEDSARIEEHSPLGIP